MSPDLEIPTDISTPPPPLHPHLIAGLLAVHALVDRIGRNHMLASSMLLASAFALALSALSPAQASPTRAPRAHEMLLGGLLFCAFNATSIIGWNVIDILSTVSQPFALSARLERRRRVAGGVGAQEEKAHALSLIHI